MHVLSLLRELGLDPASSEARRAVGLVRDRVTWPGWGPQGADNPFFAGEAEPCINGQVAASGAYFGQDVRGIIGRLLGEQLADGGWNCEAENGSTRSSFNTTICVLEALLEARTGGRGQPGGDRGPPPRAGVPPRAAPLPPAVDRRGDRARSQGRRRLDALRLPDLVALRRAAGTRISAPRRRHARRAVAEAIALVASKRDDDGRWPLETQYPGMMPVEMDEGEGGRAGGTRCAPCACWPGIQHETKTARPLAAKHRWALGLNKNNPLAFLNLILKGTQRCD